MLVKYWMRKQVVTIEADEPVQKAIVLMRENYQTLLPVVRQGRLVGTVTEEDLKRASASDAMTLDLRELAYFVSRISVEKIMTENPVTIPPDFTLIETATMLLMGKVSEAPVVDADGEIHGLISQQDLLWALMSLAGYETRGVEFAFRVDDRPGSIKEITDIIRSYNGRLVSILTSFARAPAGCRHLYVRTYGVDRQKMSEMIKDFGVKARLLYLIDHKENRRQEYEQSEGTTPA